MSQKTFTNRSWRYFYLSSVLSVLNNRGCCKTTFPSTTVKTVYSNNHHKVLTCSRLQLLCRGLKKKTKQQIVSVIKLSSLTPAELFLKGESFISIQRKISLNVLLENVVHLSALHYITVILLNRAADIQEYQFDIIRNSKKTKHNTINFVQQSITVLSDMAFFSFFFIGVQPSLG